MKVEDLFGQRDQDELKKLIQHLDERLTDSELWGRG